MLERAVFPGKYIQGAGALGELPGLVKLFGRQGLTLASPTSTRWRWASCGSTGRRRTPGPKWMRSRGYPVVLRAHGMRLLHRPLRRGPGPRHTCEHHPGPRAGIPAGAAEIGHYRDAREVGGRGRSPDAVVFFLTPG